MHPLHEALVAAASGRFPAVDGLAEVHEAAPGGDHAAIEFTGHAFILTSHEPGAVLESGADGFGGASHPDVIKLLAGQTGNIGSHDVVLVARGLLGTVDLDERADLDDHPRVVRSRQHRSDVSVHGDETGFVTIGTGLVGRTEMSVELLDPASGSHGAGRRLIEAGRHLVADGELLWAQVAPGNAASLRAFLACGFVPIGAETLITPA